MKLIVIFLFGFCFSYIINIFELCLTLLQAKISLKVTKVNAQISEWDTSGDLANPISFMLESECYEDWEDEDFID